MPRDRRLKSNGSAHSLRSDRDAIGIFDSGVGGLTVLDALRRRLPRERFIYLGDTARLPYGTKSAQTVERYALNAAAHLRQCGIKLLVVACNTASSSALPALRASFEVPVIGVVEPGALAALRTGARRIGVIGTEGTIRSGAYQEALARLDAGVDVQAAPTPLLVPLAEEGWGDHEVTDMVAAHYLRPLLESGIQALILGCTHYPLLKPSLARVATGAVRLVDSASSVAAAVAEHLASCQADGQEDPRADGRVADPDRAGEIRLQLTDASESFLRVASAILGRRPEELDVELVSLGTEGPPPR